MLQHLCTSFTPVAVCDSARVCFGEEKQVEMHICLMHVYVCIDMRVCVFPHRPQINLIRQRAKHQGTVVPY